MFIAKRQCVAFLKTVFGITVYSISILSLKPSLAFAATILCTEQMDLHGDTLQVDSYDSTNPTRSTAGQYDPAKAGDEGAVACAGGITNSIPTGAAWIYGRLYTQTNSPITLGTNGGVGTHAWLASNTGIEPGYELSTSDYRLPDTAPPFSTGLTPQSGEIVFGRVTNFYDHILYDGDYVASDLAGYTIVLGKARLLATSLLMGGMTRSQSPPMLISCCMPADRRAQWAAMALLTKAALSGRVSSTFPRQSLISCSMLTEISSALLLRPPHKRFLMDPVQRRTIFPAR